MREEIYLVWPCPAHEMSVRRINQQYFQVQYYELTPFRGQCQSYKMLFFSDFPFIFDFHEQNPERAI